MQKQIALALEKENLERESSSWLSKDKGQSSHLLQQELDRVKVQLEKYNRRDMSSFPEVVKAREAVVQCYRYVLLNFSNMQRSSWPDIGLLERGRAVQERVCCG